MPRFSYFNEPEDISFKCDLSCQQCTATSVTTGLRCKKITCKSLPVCFIHLRTLYGLKIAPSTIRGAGDGLFAMCGFEVGERICGYTGEFLSRRRIDDRYGNLDDTTAPYAVVVEAGVIDAACKRGIGAWVNEGEPNAELVEYGNRVYVEALDYIEDGDEILIDYGDEYRLQADGVSYRTRPYN